MSGKCVENKHNNMICNHPREPSTVAAGSDHYFHTGCPSFCPKTSKITAGRCGLTEWIIDDSCLEIKLSFFRDVVEGLCLRQDPQIMDGELCETLAFLFDSVLMVMVKDNRNLLTRQQKLHICSVVFSKVLRCLLECTGTVEVITL